MPKWGIQGDWQWAACRFRTAERLSLEPLLCVHCSYCLVGISLTHISRDGSWLHGIQPFQLGGCT